MVAPSTSYAAFRVAVFFGGFANRTQATMARVRFPLPGSPLRLPLPMGHPFVSRPHSMHSRYKRSCVHRTKSSCPSSQQRKETWNRISESPCLEGRPSLPPSVNRKRLTRRCWRAAQDGDRGRRKWSPSNGRSAKPIGSAGERQALSGFQAADPVWAPGLPNRRRIGHLSAWGDTACGYAAWSCLPSGAAFTAIRCGFAPSARGRTSSSMPWRYVACTCCASISSGSVNSRSNRP